MKLNLNKIENNLAENQNDSEDEGNARKSGVLGTQNKIEH